MTKKNRKANRSFAICYALVMLIVAMSTLFVACGRHNSISVDKTSVEIYVGETFKLEVTLSNPQLDVEWSSSADKVATVKRGTVTGVAEGSATITASIEGASATCTVTVKNRTVTMAEKTKEVDYDALGEDKTITLTATASDGGTLTWSSSDTNVATVNAGVVTLLKPMAKRATVTITAQRGVAKDSCELTVVCPSISDDYHVLTSGRNAEVVADPGVWHYYFDGTMGTDFNFAELPAYGSNAISVKFDKFANPTTTRLFYFRYQPNFDVDKKYTVKFTIETNLVCSLGYGTHNLYGGAVASNLKADTAKNITYVGTVNSSEPFHVTVKKITGEIPAVVYFKLTNIVVKEYETGDESQEEEIEIPSYELPTTYDLIRGTTSETCEDAGRWFYLVDPQDGNEDIKEASYNNGTLKLALHSSVKGTNTYQVRCQPRLKVGTNARVTFTVVLDAAGAVQFGLNSKQTANSQDMEVGVAKTITHDFIVTKNTPFVIQVKATDKESPITMTITDISFVEKQPETYTVTYNSNGGSTVEAASIVEGNSITTLPTPTKEGHTFGGWFESENLAGTAVAAPFKPTASITFYAKWIENTIPTYTVSYNSNGGLEVANSVVEVGKNIATLPTPTKTNFKFVGWFTSEDLSGTAVASPYTPAADVTLYAKWITALAYGDSATTCKSENLGTWFYLVSPKTSETDIAEATLDNGVLKLALRSTESLRADTYQLRYQPNLAIGKKVRATFTVVFDAAGSLMYGLNGDQRANTIVMTAGTSKTVDCVFVITENKPFVIQVVPTDNTAPIAMTITDISFVEKQPETYTVTYNSNGGSAVEAASVVEDNSIVTLPVPTKEGYNFGGWFVSEDLSGTAIVAPYKPTASITLYAKWIEQETPMYTVTFNANGGLSVDAQSIDAGGSINLPSTTKQNLVFGGWFASEDLSGTAITSPYSPTEDITLYAKWLQKFTVSFDLHHFGSKAKDSIEVTEGTAPTLPTVTRKGFTLAGWYTNAEYTGEAVNSSYQTNANITLHAKWTAVAEYDIIDGGYGDVANNRDAWYHRISNSAATVDEAKYSNGVITFNLKNAKVTTNDDIQLRYLVDADIDSQYSIKLTITSSVAGQIKVGRNDNGTKESINANEAKTVTFTTKVEINTADSQFRILLVRFYPATAGDVNISISDIEVQK